VRNGGVRTGFLILLTIIVTILIFVTVIIASIWNTAGKEIVFAVTHKKEAEICRQNNDKAITNPLLQPVINSQK